MSFNWKKISFPNPAASFFVCFSDIFILKGFETCQPLWHIDFELKALEKEQVQKELSDLSLSTYKQVI